MAGTCGGVLKLALCSFFRLESIPRQSAMEFHHIGRRREYVVQTVYVTLHRAQLRHAKLPA